MKKKKIIIGSIVNVLFLGVMITVGALAPVFDGILNLTLGSVGSSSIEGKKYSQYKTVDDITKARNKVSYDILSEGAVLLKNENETLPLQKGNKVSIFGQHAHEILASGSGSGEIGKPIRSLKDILTDASFEVNPTLWDFYTSNGGKSLGSGPALAGGNSKTDWSINEFPYAQYPENVVNSYSSYNDAAIVVISRTGGEGGDLAMDMSSYGGTADQNYLELSQEEKDLLSNVTKKFSKTIVLLNTNNTMELGFLKDYNISACLYIGGVGMSGLEAVGDLLNGTVTPSGHVSDTYVYDNFSSPASQNFGDFTYSNGDYKYVSYREGIYVGYRYYETRYYDTITGAQNVGNFNYDTTVTYPFGFGESYTDFALSNFTLNYDQSKDEFEASVDVKNIGNKYSGKEVVQFYFQAPYIHGQTKVEKSAIELAGFGKTSLLAPQASETIKVSIPKRELTSYDDATNKTYILEKGDYSFSVGTNVHEALNNILQEQGHDVSGNASLVKKYTQADDDFVTYSKDKATDTKITNLFDSAQYDGFKTISRNDWSEVDKGIKVSDLAISDEDKAQADKKGKEASLNPNLTSSEKVTAGAEVTLKLKDLIDVNYSDPKWDTLVSEIKKSDLQKLFATAGYQTIGIDYIGKPAVKDVDGPGGLDSFVPGASAVSAFGYPSETVLACTFNTKIAEEFGDMMAEDALWNNVSGWYAPGMDTHRTPFGGRNFEYYSEDGYLAGEIGKNVIQASQKKGLYPFIKHFALNEQDTNRDRVHTWASEQSMREIYFVPFQKCVEEGGATALMTSMNRIGTTAAVGNYNLVTKLLREEWGFKGMVITDYLPYDADMIMQVLFAGGDAMLSTYGIFSDKSDAVMSQLQRAAKNILYTVSRSNAMYSIKDGGEVKTGFPVYMIIVICVEIVLFLGLVLFNCLMFIPRKKKVNDKK